MKYTLHAWLIMLTMGCTSQTSHYDQLCKTFDKIGPEAVFADVRSMIDAHPDLPGTSHPHTDHVIVYPITNSLVAFGNTAIVTSNTVSIATAGLGSWRMGITFTISQNYSGNTATYYYTRHSPDEHTTKPIHPK